jgi:adenylate kinase
MNIVILGPQGSGKGTQAQHLAEAFSIPHISVGDLLRDEIAAKTTVGKQIEQLLKGGKFAPPTVVNRLVKKRLELDDAENGWILDGYPRDLNQAEFLDEVATIDAVIALDIPDKVAIARISKRRVCPKCHEVYGLAKKPKKAGVCDICKTKLVHRNDDKPAAIKQRLKWYHDETEPLIEYYKPRDIVHRINSNRDSDLVFKEILGEIG